MYFTDQNFQNFEILPVYFKINSFIIVDNFVRIGLLYTKILEIFWRFRKLMLTLIWVGFLGVRFEVERGDKITHCLKLVRILLEASNLARK